MSIENSIENAKYKEWFKDYQWKDCKLDREEHGKFLANYLASEKHGLVLNLDGSWGTGKTDFLRRMYVHLLQQGHPVIYIDAWESDFSREPLMVVASELLRQLQNLNQDIGNQEAYQKVAAKFAGFLKGAVIFGSSALTKKFFGDAEMGKIFAEQTMGHVSHESMLTLSQLHSEQVDAIKMIRQELSGLAEVLQKNYGYKIPVVVLIDELDRCRPDYSIEMLEVIKHFFNADNMVFMVASDTAELCKSISVVYGSAFNTEKYLRRFFNRTARLAEPNIESFVHGMFDDISSGVEYVHTDIFSTKLGLDFIFSVLCNNCVKKIGLRDVEQIAAKLKAIYMQASSCGRETRQVQYINFAVLASGLILHHFDPVDYRISNFEADKFRCSMVVFNAIDLMRLIALFYSMAIYPITVRSEAKKYFYEEFAKIVDRDVVNEVTVKLDRDFVGFLRDIDLRFENNGKRLLVDDGKWWMLADYQRIITLSGSLE